MPAAKKRGERVAMKSRKATLSLKIEYFSLQEVFQYLEEVVKLVQGWSDDR